MKTDTCEHGYSVAVCIRCTPPGSSDVLSYGTDHPDPPEWQLDPNGQLPKDSSEPADKVRSWRPQDISSVLDGTYEPPQATVGARSDGIGMFYRSRKHTVSSESEGGKTWLLLATSITEIERGNSVVYLDFEDEAGGVVGRLMSMQLPAQSIRDRFAYVRPEQPLDVVGRSDLAQALGDMHPTFVVIDGVTEAMVLHGLDPLSNKDAATFGRMLPTGIANMGPAVCSLDHVTKAAEGRGRYSLGAVHKLNGLDGAAYVLENRTPFGIGLTGRSTVKIGKDRPGQLRRHGKPSSGGMHWFADLVLDSQHESFVLADIEPPTEKTTGDFRPTVLMGRVVEALNTHGPLSQRRICAAVRGNAKSIREALDFLILDGFVSESTPHTLLKTYESGSEK
ncbi:AAA family ATPase [Jiangella mangrovi]|uniref:Uncharacterized protein n=1 Tax=Jiangella mangrovi TaxID=1524084 RepID=A0A7W9GLN8_9ACTN|nr:AAA family ATPase [Jiangella mangrovi]MBB5785986.1 hypothetical protein [Jiangella mangrovi]